LLLLAIPVACISWTVTHEEVFREPREYCFHERSSARSLMRRKFFYVFTCEYCFSHYVAAAILALTRCRLLFPDWRGYFISFFALVWIANQYMSVYNRLRLDIKHEQVEIKAEERDVSRAVDQRKARSRSLRLIRQRPELGKIPWAGQRGSPLLQSCRDWHSRDAKCRRVQ
jgi:hypothetical protein